MNLLENGVCCNVLNIIALHRNESAHVVFVFTSQTKIVHTALMNKFNKTIYKTVSLHSNKETERYKTQKIEAKFTIMFDFKWLMRKRLTNSFKWLLQYAYNASILCVYNLFRRTQHFIMNILCVERTFFLVPPGCFFSGGIFYFQPTYREFHILLNLIWFFFVFLDDCQRAIEMLKTVELIESDLNGCISSLPFGTVMAKYFLSITTMQAFRGVSIILSYLSCCFRSKLKPLVNEWKIRPNCIVTDIKTQKWQQIKFISIKKILWFYAFVFTVSRTWDGERYFGQDRLL